MLISFTSLSVSRHVSSLMQLSIPIFCIIFLHERGQKIICSATPCPFCIFLLLRTASSKVKLLQMYYRRESFHAIFVDNERKLGNDWKFYRIWVSRVPPLIHFPARRSSVIKLLKKPAKLNILTGTR